MMKKMRIKSSLFIFLLIMVMVCTVVGGTLALLTVKTAPITNEFTLGDITYILTLEPNVPAECDDSTLFMPGITPESPHTDSVGSVLFTLTGDGDDVNPKLPGYDFIGWFADREVAQDAQPVYPVDTNEIKVGYNDPDPVYTNKNEVILTLFAQWKNSDIDVTFDTQVEGLVADPASKTVTYLGEYGDLPVVEREGYTFDGWTLERSINDGEDFTVIFDSSIVKIPNDHTLYAQWTPHTYTVVYDANDTAEDGSEVTPATGETENSVHTYDVAKNLTKNGYERTGYTFAGWNTQPDGKGTAYSDEQSVVNLTSENEGIVTLYAQWESKSYVLRYHANGGEGKMADQVIKYDVPTELYENEFTKDDYSFMGWALTPDGEVKYIDQQVVVNLLESGTLDLYAVWAQDSHTVYFNYNGGTGSPDSKKFQNGKPYGQLPEYPVHPTKVISDNEVMAYLFTGWYTEPVGGTRVYPSDIANRTDDHTLYAHWKEAPTNNVIKDIVVKNNPDDDKDGVVDDIYLNLKCSSSFEKFNVPLENLVIGQTYTLTYTASNDASFGDYITGYKNSVYGSYIVATEELTGGRIDTSDVPYYGMDLLATWYDRVEPDGTNHDGSHAAINDEYLQGPWKDRTITFTATENTMYWTWDFGLMQDGILDNYNMTDIVLEPVVPTIEFGNKKLIVYSSSKAQVLDDNSSAYGSSFTFDGDGYAETVYYPISGLTAGTTYTITFNHRNDGKLIDNEKYHYGCGISSVEPKKFGSYMTDLEASWISSTPVFTNLNTTESVTLTFTAAGNTAYWVWNMANCSDSYNCPISIEVTKFSVKDKNGNSLIYHEIASGAAVMYTANPYEDAVSTVELPENTFEGESYSFVTMPEESELEMDVYSLTELEQSYAVEQGWEFYGWLLDDGSETQIFTTDFLGDLDEKMFWFFYEESGFELTITPLFKEVETFDDENGEDETDPSDNSEIEAEEVIIITEEGSIGENLILDSSEGDSIVAIEVNEEDVDDAEE